MPLREYQICHMIHIKHPRHLPCWAAKFIAFHEFLFCYYFLPLEDKLNQK